MTPDPRFSLRIAASNQDLIAVQRLRYQVFIDELGGDGPLVDHAQKREIDLFDTHASHLMLCDDAAPGAPVVGAYRLMSSAQADAAGGFSSRREYDLSQLTQSGRSLLELGRSCVLPAYRNGAALMHLWKGLADVAQDWRAQVLFGAASFQGCDPAALSAPLAYLRAYHLAPQDLRTQAVGPGAVTLPGKGVTNRKQALMQVPSLIKAYLRLGGCIGDGAYVDYDFNTTDVCMIVDLTQSNLGSTARHRRGLYSSGAGT